MNNKTNINFDLYGLNVDITYVHICIHGELRGNKSGKNIDF